MSFGLWPITTIMNRCEYILKTVHGLLIPRSAKHALKSDKVNQNHQYRGAMTKEICTTEDFEVFEQINGGENFSRSKGFPRDQ